MVQKLCFMLVQNHSVVVLKEHNNLSIFLFVYGLNAKSFIKVYKIKVCLHLKSKKNTEIEFSFPKLLNN